MQQSRCRAAVLLMGCSSGALQPLGVFEPSGMAISYVLSGAPATVANLWDVTDRDIDGFTQRVLDVSRGKGGSAMGPILIPSTFACFFQTCLSGGDLLQVVAQARDACTLPYLNGAAPVVYGIPVTFFAQA